MFLMSSVDYNSSYVCLFLKILKVAEWIPEQVLGFGFCLEHAGKPFQKRMEVNTTLCTWWGDGVGSLWESTWGKCKWFKSVVCLWIMTNIHCGAWGCEREVGLKERMALPGFVCVCIQCFCLLSLLAGVEREDPSLASQLPVWLMINYPF